jgi:hypothetical protein
MGNQKWTIQRDWQHGVHHSKKNTTQYVLDTTMRKQTLENTEREIKYGQSRKHTFMNACDIENVTFEK